MDTGIFAAFSKKVISAMIALGSMFYSTIDGVTPKVEPIRINFKNDAAYISTTLSNCYTTELDQILQSGNEIPLYFLVELFEKDKIKPDTSFTFRHSIRYSPIDYEFIVRFEYSDKNYTSLDFRQAKALFPQINELKIVSLHQIVGGNKYYIKITAWLDRIKLEGMDEELNLLYYWNSMKPSSKSPIFTMRDFQV